MSTPTPTFYDRCSAALEKIQSKIDFAIDARQSLDPKSATFESDVEVLVSEMKRFEALRWALQECIAGRNAKVIELISAKFKAESLFEECEQERFEAIGVDDAEAMNQLELMAKHRDTVTGIEKELVTMHEALNVD